MFVLIVILGCSCSKKQCGFELISFRITNNKFNSLLNDFVESRSYKVNPRVYFVCIEKVDTLGFRISSDGINGISSYIFDHNYRIMGYLPFEDKDILLLANPCIKRIDAEMALNKIMTPTLDIKNIEYLYYDVVYSDTDIYPRPSPISDLQYKRYRFINESFILME